MLSIYSGRVHSDDSQYSGPSTVSSECTVSRPAGSSKLLRAMNESAALAHLLEAGRLTRAELSRLTALSTPTVSDVLRRLSDAGLATVVGHDRGRRGPNAEIYAANPDAAYTVAMSVPNATDGLSSITAALCDLTGRIRARLRTDVDFLRCDPASVIGEAITRLHEQAGVAPEHIRHVQIGVAGWYDRRTATIRHVKIPGWNQAGLVPAIAQRIGTRVDVDNDVNLAAVAERRHGAARQAEGFALLWLGDEGLGLAIDIAGNLMRGARGGAGEIGYIPLFAPDDGGSKVDLQALVGGPAVLALAHEHGIAGRTAAEAVASAVRDPGGERFVAVLADRICIGLAAVVAVLDPSLVVLAGQVARSGGEVLRRAVNEAVLRAVPLEAGVVVTTIDDDAVLLGAVDAGLTVVRDTIIASLGDTTGPRLNRAG